MPYPTTGYTKTPLPSEYSAAPVENQPFSDIEIQYNKIVRSLKELWGCIEGSAVGNDINGTALTDYSADSNMGLLPRLSAIEASGKIQNSAYLQLGTSLSAGNRGIRFTLGSVNLYGELYYDNDSGNLFKFRSQAGGLLRVQGATPTNSNDFATKYYVDSLTGAGQLKKHCNVTAPVRASNTTISIDYAYLADSTGTVFMAKPTATTVSISSTGLNGILSSSVSNGISGTISVTSGAATITGVGTSFTTDFIAGDWIVTAGGQSRKVSSVTNNTSLTVTSNFSSTETTVSYSRGGVNIANGSENNLYAFCDAAGVNIGFGFSTRNVQGGDTLVDLPRTQKTGTVSVSNGSPDINGSGTSFTTEFVVGQQIHILSGGTGYVATLSEIVSNTLMRVTGNFGVGLSGATISVMLDKYRQLPYGTMTDGSGNLLDHRVLGFPWNTCIELLAYDGTSRYSICSSQTATTSQSSNIVTGSYVPDLCNKIGAIIYSTMVSQASAPGFFQVAPSSAVLGSYVNTMSVIQVYNSNANFSIVTNSQCADIPLDSSGNIYWKSSSSNVSGGIGFNRVYLTGWKG